MLGFPPSSGKWRKVDNDEIPSKKKQTYRAKTEIGQKKRLTQAKKTIQKRPQARGKTKSVQKIKQEQNQEQKFINKNITIQSTQAKKTIVPVNRQIYQIPIYVQDDKPYKSPFIHKITADCIVPDNSFVKSLDESDEEVEKSKDELQVKEEHDLKSDVKVELDLSIIKDEPVI